MSKCLWQWSRFKKRHVRLTDNVYSRKEMYAFQEAEPAANDLSSLCYYAQSKPAKLAKIGNHLERRVQYDCRRRRLG
jgi:hypothetical protein